MENFIAFNPVKLHFGKGVVGDLGEAAAAIGSHALLVYGKGSVLRNGSYEDTLQQLKSHNIKVTEFSGIKPNPLAGDVDEAADTGRKEKVDMVVAVGGGSVIDSAKIIAVSVATGKSAWEVMNGKAEPVKALPLLAVLTLAATGTEMNPVAVLQNPETRQKKGYRHPSMYPAHSFLDPAYTQSVPANYTAYGVVDLTAHCLEAFFGEGDASLSDRYVEVIIKEALEYGPALMEDLDNYELRADIMWAATNALNGLTSYGRKTGGDWGVHALGHVLSFLYDTAHGATLSIVYPAWLKKMRERIPERIADLGSHLFDERDPDMAILGLERFFRSLGSPVRCQEAGIGEDEFHNILDLMNENRSEGLVHKLSDGDREDILRLMYGM